MDRNAYQEACQALPDARTRFAYFKDRYALKLLELAFGEGTPIKRVKGSPFAPLLTRDPVTRALARCGDGLLSHGALLGVWPTDYEVFWLSHGCWNTDYYARGYAQTSRPGCNVVLQLCFSARHDRPYRRYIRPLPKRDPFMYRGHPIAREGLTLAWARLDIDTDGGEALIEEIQSDWVRGARHVGACFTDLREPSADRRVLWGKVDGAVRHKDVARYLEHVLWRYEKLWDEAMLCAVLEFLHSLGIRTVYCHSPESSRVFKAPVAGEPPRSLYTRLPRRFCFTRTETPPQLLRSCRERFVQRLVKQHRVPWHVLML